MEKIVVFLIRAFLEAIGLGVLVGRDSPRSSSSPTNGARDDIRKEKNKKPVIGNAIQSGMAVLIYDESGNPIGAIPVGNEPEDGLTGYTSTTVSVRRGRAVYIYDARGNTIRAHPVLARPVLK